MAAFQHFAHPVSIDGGRLTVQARHTRQPPVYVTLQAGPVYLSIDLSIGQAEELRAALSRAIADLTAPAMTRDEVPA